MSIKLLHILKKQISEQGGKFRDMIDLQGKTAGEYYAGAVVDDDMNVSDVLSKYELNNYSGEVTFEGEPEEVDTNLYDSINFKNIGLGNPIGDKINSSLLFDVNKAAKKAGTIASITTAVSGHGPDGRHGLGLAVDVAMFDDKGYNGVESAKQNGIYDKIEKFVKALESMGYTVNSEGGNDKAVLWFGFEGHHHHVHVSRKSYYKNLNRITK